MKYFLVVGEASGDLHASHLMKALQRQDPAASFVYMGGTLMRAVGGECVLHSEEMAFMGVVDVLQHLGRIRRGAALVQAAMLRQQPDMVVCVDYAGFCFRYILPFVRKQLPATQVVYYIPPKVWAWKKYRIKQLRKETDWVLSIFPFEVPFFEKEGLPQVVYVGNPTVESVTTYLEKEALELKLESESEELPPSIAILCGSRTTEIRRNLPTMLRVVRRMEGYLPVIAAAPGVPVELYRDLLCEASDLGGLPPRLVVGDTYGVVRRATAALVTSGTATLETALLGTPQVVCYSMRGGHLPNFVFKHFFSVPYISLVNLIAHEEVVQELYGALFTEERIYQALLPLLSQNSPERVRMLAQYREVHARLQTPLPAATVAAQKIYDLR